MIQFILSLLGLGNKLSRIQSRSDGALASFNKTLNDLKSTSKMIADHTKEHMDAIAEANAKIQALNNISASNSKVIAKLEEFLS